MNNRLRSTIIALGLAPALFLSEMATANDGREFGQCRPANNPDGRLLTAAEVVNSRELTPRRSSRYFKTPKESYPRLESRRGSLYFCKSAADSLCVAKGGDGIVYGESVSRHEFGIDKGIFIAPDSTKAAFYRKDESKVALFPFLDIKGNGSLKSVRYPMNGCKSEELQLGVYDFTEGSITYLDTAGDFDAERYLTNVAWSPDSREIYVQVVDRPQKNMHLNRYNALDGSFVETVLTEQSDTWIEPQYPLEWVKGSGKLALYATDNRDGFWNLYIVNVDRHRIERLTCVDKDVKYLANDGKYVYFTAPDEHPVNNYLWRVNIKSKRTDCLTPEIGWHSIQMAPDCKSYVDVYESLNQAPCSILKSIEGKVLKTIYAAKDPTEKWAFSEICMGTVTSANGSDINYYRMVKPLNFDPSKKYPLVLYVYGGPHSQLVQNKFLGNLRRWEMYLAQKGFVVFTMDNRGTLNHGAGYEHSIHRECGQAAMADQMQAVSMLKEIPWIDSGRIGVYGWSFGGFMSLSLATAYPECFKVCVAGGPVIDWKWYEVMYGERYMETAATNAEGFGRTSLLDKAKDLKARTLVIEGGLDDTVVPLHAFNFIQQCVSNGVKVDFFMYPVSAHNMRGVNRVHLVEKVTDFFCENL